MPVCRETHEFRKYGDTPILTWGPDEWRPHEELIPRSLLRPSAEGESGSKIDDLLNQVILAQSLSPETGHMCLLCESRVWPAFDCLKVVPVRGLTEARAGAQACLDCRPLLQGLKSKQRKNKTERVVWTREEDRTLFEQFKKYGTSWTEVCRLLPGRTTNACKNRWIKLQALQPDILKGIPLHIQSDAPPAEITMISLAPLKNKTAFPTTISLASLNSTAAVASLNSTAAVVPVSTPAKPLPAGAASRGERQHDARLDPRLVEILKLRKDEIQALMEDPDIL